MAMPREAEGLPAVLMRYRMVMAWDAVRFHRPKWPKARKVNGHYLEKPSILTVTRRIIVQRVTHITVEQQNRASI